MLFSQRKRSVCIGFHTLDEINLSLDVVCSQRRKKIVLGGVAYNQFVYKFHRCYSFSFVMS